MPRREPTEPSPPPDVLTRPVLFCDYESDAPTICPRCSGPLRTVDTGRACWLCPFQVYVRATIRFNRRRRELREY